MRVEGSTRKFGDLAAKIIAEGEARWEKIQSGEIPPPQTDANGNIIPSPSTRKPNVFDGLNLTRDNPAEIC